MLKSFIVKINMFLIAVFGYTLKFLDGYEESKLNFKRWGKPPGNVNWWKPEELGEGAKYYEKKSKDGRIVEGIYIKAMEVYYVNRLN